MRSTTIHIEEKCIEKQMMEDPSNPLEKVSSLGRLPADKKVNGTLPEDAYLRLLNSKFAVKDCVRIMMVIVNYVLRKMGIKLTETMLEAEAWRAMIRTSQKLYPAKMRKGFPEKIIHNIRLIQFRMDPQKMLEHYNTRYLPILGKRDPLAMLKTLSYRRYIFL